MDPLSTKFAALADPTRRAILARLVLGETSVTELAEPFAMSMPAVSKHLKVLEHAGLVTRGRAAQWRGDRQSGVLSTCAFCTQDVGDWGDGGLQAAAVVRVSSESSPHIPPLPVLCARLHRHLPK